MSLLEKMKNSELREKLSYSYKKQHVSQLYRFTLEVHQQRPLEVNKCTNFYWLIIHAL